MSSTQPAGPVTADQARLLERAVVRLEASAEPRMLVRLVEKWAELGHPPARVRLSQARAFLHLRLMDRAWVRLREVGDNLGDDPEVLALTAEMFVERGWPVRARKAVGSALAQDPSNPRLHDLLRRAHQPPVQPPSNARELERTGTPPELLRLAERFLCAGSFLRARSILEKLRRQRGPWSGRVEDLLWGLEGDFTSGVDDPVAVAQALLSTSPLAEVGDMTDHSEVTAHGDASVPDHEDVAFPSLFRRVDDDSTDAADFTGEVTRISRMAAPTEAQAVVPGDDTDSGAWSEDVPMDTQIQVVVNKDGGGPLHHRKDETDDSYDLKKSLNLREYQNQMGMGDLGADLAAPDMPTADSDLADYLQDDSEFLEEEDDDLIVMTRREADPSELPDELDIPSGPIEVIERPLGPPPRPVPEPSPPPAQAPRSSPARRRARSPGSAKLAGGNLLVVAGAGLLCLVLLVFLGTRLYGSWVASSVWADTATVLAQGSYKDLLQEEGRLEALLKSEEPPRGTYLAAYAVLELVLYGEFTGGEPRLTAAQETTVEAVEHGARGELVALAAAWRAHLLGDDTAARGLLDQLDDSEPEVSYLRSLVALESGHFDDAVDAARRATESSSGSARYLLGLARACQKVGDKACVDGAFARAAQAGPTHAAVRLASVSFGGGDRQAQLGSLERFLDDSGRLAPRLQGRAHARSAELLQAEDPAGAGLALRLALAADPDNPQLLYRVAAVRLAANQPQAAIRELGRCLSLRPLDIGCHAGLVQARLELDRVDEAEAGIVAMPEALQRLPRTHLMRAWTAATGRDAAEQAREHLDAYLAAGGAEDGEVMFLRGLALALGDDVSSAVAQLEAAAARLAQDADPLLQRLAPRALAVAALVAGPVDGRRLAVQALRAGSEDAWVHVQLGRMEDAGGNRKDAERHYGRAIELGPDLALAHYHRGNFFLDDPRRGKRQETWASWRRYLALDPTGPRAERASRHLGYR